MSMLAAVVVPIRHVHNHSKCDVSVANIVCGLLVWPWLMSCLEVTCTSTSRVAMLTWRALSPSLRRLGGAAGPGWGGGGGGGIWGRCQLACLSAGLYRHMLPLWGCTCLNDKAQCFHNSRPAAAALLATWWLIGWRLLRLCGSVSF